MALPEARLPRSGGGPRPVPSRASGGGAVPASGGPSPPWCSRRLLRRCRPLAGCQRRVAPGRGDTSRLSVRACSVRLPPRCPTSSGSSLNPSASSASAFSPVAARCPRGSSRPSSSTSGGLPGSWPAPSARDGRRTAPRDSGSATSSVTRSSSGTPATIHVAGVDEAGMAPARRTGGGRGGHPPAELQAARHRRQQGARRRDPRADGRRDPEARRGRLGRGRGRGRGDRPAQHLPRGLLAMRRAVLGLPAVADLRAGGRPPDPRVPGAAAGHHPRRRAVADHRRRLGHRQDHARRAHGRARRPVPRLRLRRAQGLPHAAARGRARALGACPIHRRSFAPVRQALGLDPVQEMLFEPPPVPPEPSGP